MKENFSLLYKKLSVETQLVAAEETPAHIAGRPFFILIISLSLSYVLNLVYLTLLQTVNSLRVENILYF